MNYWCDKCNCYFKSPYYCIHYYQPEAPALTVRNDMRLYCYTCFKSVSNELPEDTTVRALLICPECIAKGKIIFKENDK